MSVRQVGAAWMAVGACMMVMGRGLTAFSKRGNGGDENGGDEDGAVSGVYGGSGSEKREGGERRFK